MIYIKNYATIPNAVQITMDDIGWFDGYDKRYKDEPSRTGIPRKHHPLDYRAVNEIGKAIGMKIMCPLVIGEWDKNNLLRSVEGATYMPHTWDCASKINVKLANECLEEIENSDYIEFALHGLLHGNYDKNGRQINELEYFNTNTENNVSSCKTEEEINRTFDIFYEIYNSWGFTKEIRSFSEPGEPPKYIGKNDVLPLANALAERGIKYWTNYWIKDTLYYDSVLYMAKTNNFIPPWNAYDLDPTYLRDFTLPTDEKEYTILGLHWPNFLKFHPENNLSVVPLWKEYFRRQSEIFGLMVSKDIAFAGNQHVYRQLSKIEENDAFLCVDVADVYSQPSVEPYGYFYLSIKNELTPVSSEGCSFELYESHNDFKTYKITHTAKQMKIFLK